MVFLKGGILETLVTWLRLVVMIKFPSEYCYAKTDILQFNFFRIMWKNSSLWVSMDQSLQRRTRPKMFCNKAVLRNFLKLAEKHVNQSSFLTKFEF